MAATLTLFVGMTYKVFVKVFGENTYCTNAMEYNTKEEAEEAGHSLASRWTLVDKYEVRAV